MMKKLIALLLLSINILLSGGTGAGTPYHIDLYLTGLPENETVTVANQASGDEIELNADGTTGFDTSVNEQGKYYLDISAQPNGAYCYIERKGGFYLEDSPTVYVRCVDINSVFIVNSTEDNDDSNLSDGVCDDGNGYCTLRAAINQSNQIDSVNTVVLQGANYQISSELSIENNLTIMGEDKALTIIDAGGNSRVFTIADGKSVDIYNLTISNGNADMYEGGGIDIGQNTSVDIKGIAIKDCNGTSGGAIRAQQGSNVTIVDSLFSGNIATGKAMNTGNGGAIEAQGDYITINKSLFLSNEATSSSSDTYGGAIYLNAGTAEVENITIDSNKAKYGGGIAVNENTTLYMRNSTITQNDNSGLYIDSTGTNLYLYNNLIVNQNTGDDCSGSSDTHDYRRNIDSDGSCGFYKSIEAFPLEPLADNGGPTLTRAIRYDSAARDTGDGELCAYSDQRSATRVDGACDIGAFEYFTFPIISTLNLTGVNLSEHNITSVKIRDAKNGEEVALFDNIQDGDNSLQFDAKDGEILGLEAQLDGDSSKIYYYDFKTASFKSKRDGSADFYTIVSQENSGVSADASSTWEDVSANYPPKLHINNTSYNPLGKIAASQAQQIAIDRSRKILYVGIYDDNDNSAIASYDYRDAGNPVLLASVSDSSNRVNDLILSGGESILYAARESGLYIYDVSDTASISEIGTLFNSDYNLYKMAYSSDKSMLFILGDDSSDDLQHIYIVDVSAPDTPSHIATIDLDSNKGFIDLAVRGDRLYIFSRLNTADTYDITDPSNPAALNIHPPVSTGVISDDGKLIYGANLYGDESCPHYKVGVYDLENSEWKSYIDDNNSCDYSKYASVAVDDTLTKLYITGDDKKSIVILDVSDINSVKLKDFIHENLTLTSTSQDIVYADNMLFTADYEQGRVSIWSQANDTLFKTVTETKDLDSYDVYWENTVKPLKLFDGYQYLGGVLNETNSGELIKIDETNFDNISILTLDDSGNGTLEELRAYSIISDNYFSVGGYIYGTETSCGLSIIDVNGNYQSDIYDCGGYDTEITAMTASKRHMTVYAGVSDSYNYASSLFIYNENGILSKTDLGTYDEKIKDITLGKDGNMLYAIVGDSLMAIDISDPYYPETLSSIAIENGVSLSIDNVTKRAYILSSADISGTRTLDNNQISVVDISDSNNLQLLTQYRVSPSGAEPAVRVSTSSDPHMIVSSDGAAIQISDPDNTVEFPAVSYWDGVTDTILSSNNAKVTILEEESSDYGPLYFLKAIDITPRIYLPEGFGSYDIPVNLFDREGSTLRVTTDVEKGGVFTVSSGEGDYNASDYLNNPVTITISENSVGMDRLWVKVEDNNSFIREMPVDIEIYPILQRDLNLPKAPSNLSAEEIKSDRVSLIWTDNSDNEEGFRVYRSEDYTNFSVVGSSAKDVTDYTDDTVAPDTNYTYRVVAYNANGESDYTELNVTTPKAPPAAPQNLKAVSVSSDSITIEWSDVNGEDGYRIYRDGTLLADNLAAGTVNYTDDSVDVNTTYTYIVSAYNSEGENNSSALTVDNTPTPPQAPASVNVTIDNGKALIKWQDSSDDENGFKLYRDGVLLDSNIPANTTSYTDDTIEPDHQYDYCVSAYNDAGDSSKTCSSVETPIEQPAPPADLTAEAYPHRVELNWRDIADNEANYVLKRNGKVLDEKIPKDSTHYTDDSVSPDSNYTYELAARNEAGDSAYISVKVTTPKDVPEAPSELRADAHPANVYLQWMDNADNEDGFILYRGGKILTDTIPVDATEYNDTTVKEDSYYIYRLSAFNKNGESKSISVTVRTPQSIPLAPTELNATATGRSVTLHWKDNAFNEDVYRLYRDSELITDKIAANSVSYTDSRLEPEHEYTYKLTAYNSAGESEPAYITVKTTKDIPRAPSDFKANADTPDRVLLEWTDNSGIETGFVLYRNGEILDENIPADTTHYTDDSVKADTDYSYRLLARNDDGDSDSVTTEVTTPFTMSYTLLNISQSPREIKAVSIIDKNGTVLSTLVPGEGENSSNLYLRRGQKFAVAVDAAVYSGDIKRWYLNFTSNILTTAIDYKTASSDFKTLNIYLDSEHWQKDKPLFIHTPSDMALSENSSPVTVDIEIDHSNYEGLQLEADDSNNSIIEINSQWDEENIYSNAEYKKKVFKLDISPKSPGEATVTLTLTDNLGHTEKSSFSVVVGKDVYIKAYPTEGRIPLDVNFSAVINQDFGEVKSILWDFGDGERAKESNVSHRYSEEGIYEVTLTVTGADGKEAKDSKTITATETKYLYHLVSGRNDISLPSHMRLKEEDLQKLFGDNRIDMLVKQTGYGWSYWDRDKDAKPERQMPRFSILDSTEGFIIYAKESFDLAIPYDENESEHSDDFVKLQDSGWYFIGVNRDMSVEEINTLVSKQSKELEMIEYFDSRGTMHFYSPIPDIEKSTSQAIPRLKSVERGWGFFIKIR